MGTKHLQAGRHEQAAADLTKAVIIRPDYFSAHNQLGTSLLKMGRVDQAVSHYREAVRTGPEHPGLRHNLGCGLARQGDYQDAIDEFRKALNLRPDYIILLDSLAEILSTCEDPEYRDRNEAIRLAQRACELSGYRAAPFLNTLAVAYAEVGRFTQACQIGEKALEAALSAGQDDLARQIEQRLKLYRQGRAHPE